MANVAISKPGKAPRFLRESEVGSIEVFVLFAQMSKYKLEPFCILSRIAMEAGF